ncbi:GGDEF domain-containing protein [Balneatrix alpica]|uniref:diguanylate cyclase n=1 Tax=Balneatrix alpica TaxID=75684 RepID=A0ABV5Z7R2_9GAMM|nr:diguanylate cyclase [Balneatrix alpica]
MRTLLSSNLALRQTRMTLLIAVLLGVVMALGQISLDLNYQRQRQDKELYNLTVGASSSASQALWTLNEPLAQAVIEGVVSHPLISSAYLSTHNGLVLNQQQELPLYQQWPQWMPYLLGEPYRLDIPLYSPMKAEQVIGQLSLLVDPYLATKELSIRILTLVVMSLLKAMLLAIALLALFFHTGTRPLLQHIRWLHRLDPEHPEHWHQPAPQYPHQDEIQSLAKVTESLLRKAQHHFHLRQQAQQNLLQLNQVLEQRVQERTQALEQALRQMEKLATVDELTGVFNRRAFLQRAEQRYAEWQRYQHPFAFLMLDIDYFKRINDTYGHPEGDRALQQISQMLQQRLRKEDVLGRLGGEEFGILLGHNNAQQALQAAQQLCHYLHQHPLQLSSGPYPISLSIGVASSQEQHNDFESMQQAADRALYQAKQQGRNQAVLAMTAEH